VAFVLDRVSQHGTPAKKKKVRAAVHHKYPDMGGYAGGAGAGSGIGQAGGYDPAPQGRPVLVHERSYYTDQPPPSLGRLFEAPGVSHETMGRLRNALMDMFEDHR
jgi:hypothetical protein